MTLHWIVTALLAGYPADQTEDPIRVVLDGGVLDGGG